MVVAPAVFAVAGLARTLHVDPEAALRRATDRFIARFAAIESSHDVASLSPDEWNQYWNEAK